MTDQKNASLVERLAKFWLAWFGVYMVTGAFALTQHRTSFFADTVDHVDSLWVKLIFLNLPLQIVLALTAIQLNMSQATGMQNLAKGIALINSGLIVVHIVISVFLHFTQ